MSKKMLVHFKHLIRPKLPVFLVFTVAFFLSIYRILARPLFFDEIVYIDAGVWYVNLGWWFFNWEHPPVFKLIVGAVLWLAGVRTTPWIPFPPPLGKLLVTYPPPAYVVYIARLPAAFMGSLTTVLVYYLAKELTKNQKTSLISGLFLALYPAHLIVSQMVMLDVPLNFFVTLSLLLMYRALASNDKRYLIIGSLVYGLALGTKLPATMILPILLTLAMALPNRKRNLAYVGLSTLIALTILLLVWSYIWPNPLGNLVNLLFFNGEKKFLFRGNLPYSFWSWCILNATPIPVLIFFLFGFALAVRRLKRPMVLLALTWFLVPFTFMTISIRLPLVATHWIHYFVWLTPSICLIAGYGLSVIDNWMQKHKPQLYIRGHCVSYPANFHCILIAIIVLTALLAIPTYQST